MTTRRSIRSPWLRAALGCALAVLVAGCGADPPNEAGDDAPIGDATPAALALLASTPSPYAAGVDVWEVWTCHVPITVGHPLYDDDTWRLARTADELTPIFDRGVGEWFAERSHGVYRPEFRAGGRVRISSAEDDSDCVARALARVGAGANGVLVVADAVHREGMSGGWGRPGRCGSPCRASTADVTGRAVYVGAADFTPAWGDEPPLDLVQHEIGHALDLPHSGDDVGGDRYSSPLDVMSNSSAPRQVDPDRRDAPDTIAANRIALGWLSLTDVAVVPLQGATIALAPSTQNSGRRVAVVPLDEWRLVTIELLVPRGANSHLPGPGIAIHLVDQSAEACDNPTGPLCTGQYRRQIPLGQGSLHPGIALLGEGDRADVGPVVVRVMAVNDSTGRVAIEPG